MFDGCQRASSAQVVALRLHRLHRLQSDGAMNKLNIIPISLVYKRRFSWHQMVGFAWDQLAVWSVKLSTHLSQRAIHTRRASFVSRCPPRHGTTGDLSKLASKPSRDTNLTSPSSYNDRYYRLWSLIPRARRSRSLLGYTLNCALHRERTN